VSGAVATGTNGVRGSLSAFFLVGPTAVGKTAVAHRIAVRHGRSILSADSMLLYKGMDLGTAKPSSDELAEVRYYGVDLVSPGASYSVWDYREYALTTMKSKAPTEEIMVVGGSGLYVKALTHGLADRPGADDDLRLHWEQALREDGIEPLRHALKEHCPEAYEALPDNQNARRLIRALEAPEHVSGAGKSTWEQEKTNTPLIGLSMKTDQLNARIEKRVHRIYDSGLVNEVRDLRDSGIDLSGTARQAIGYAEAFDCMEGRCSIDEAVERTTTRTRRLAKKQRTWFRHQTKVVWIEVDAGDTIEDTATRVMDEWRKHGPTGIQI